MTATATDEELVFMIKALKEARDALGQALADNEKLRDALGDVLKASGNAELIPTDALYSIQKKCKRALGLSLVETGEA